MNNDIDFLDTNFAFALVVKGNIDEIKGFKEYLAKYDKVDYIYQRISTDRLYISDTPSEREDNE